LIAAATGPAISLPSCRAGSRPDLAGAALARVTAPTLLIVGGFDTPVIQLNRDAVSSTGKVKLEIVPGATHLFEEPGTLERVLKLAGTWFEHYLQPASDTPSVRS
jgi:pimeloyl-ACP methyl ester carboxylesterase